MHCCILLDSLCELYYDARIHEHQMINSACSSLSFHLSIYEV